MGLGTGFDDGAHEKTDEASDDRSDDRNEEKAAESAAMLAERKEMQRHESGLEERCDDGRTDAGYNADHHVVRSPPHYPGFRAGRFEFFLSCGSAMSPRLLQARDLAEFEALAAQIARALAPGDVVALEGDLGSGKTTFVAAAVKALGSDADVTSPTFTFWHRYGGSPALEHLDLYRIEDPAEAAELGLEEAFGPGRIVFVEWPGRLPGFVPAGAIRIRISGAGAGLREIEIA
jgi:tRNA threonylcarbamoyladenosine biosynthesis protein TsaE